MSHTYLVDHGRDDWQGACQLVNYLLREGADVRWATEPFQATLADGQQLELARGSYLVAGVKSLSPAQLDAAQERYGARLQRAASIDGFVGLALHSLSIALYGGGGAPFNHARIYAALGFDVAFISPQEIRQGRLDGYDLLVVPGGGGLAMVGQLQPLGADGCRAIAHWVKNGGMYVGSCAGAFDAALVAESFLEVCPQQRLMRLVNAKVWNRGDTEWIGLESPGIGLIESRNMQPAHPVMFGVPKHFPITHYNGPFFEIAADDLADASKAVGLGAVAGHGRDFTPAEYFLRASQADAAEPTLLNRAADEGIFNIVCGYKGMGRALLFGSHPEFGYNLAMDAWDEPARMLANAAHWQSAHLPASRSPTVARAPGTALPYPGGSGFGRIVAACNAISDAVERLHDAPPEDAAWLAEDHAMSVFGLSGRDIWQRGLDDFSDIFERMHVALHDAKRLSQRAKSLLAEREPADPRRRRLSEMLLALDEAITYRTPAEWQQDFGYEGIVQMLERAENMLRQAHQNRQLIFEASDNPYAYFDSSPYQLVVGSYLAANGVYLNSWQLLVTHLRRIDEQIFAIEAAGKTNNMQRQCCEKTRSKQNHVGAIL